MIAAMSSSTCLARVFLLSIVGRATLAVDRLGRASELTPPSATRSPAFNPLYSNEILRSYRRVDGALKSITPMTVY